MDSDGDNSSQQGDSSQAGIAVDRNDESEDVVVLQVEDSSKESDNEIDQSNDLPRSNVNNNSNNTQHSTANESTVVGSPPFRDVRTDQRRTWTIAEMYAVDRASWSWFPNLQQTHAGQSITLTILTAARTEGYAVTLDYPYRTDWFERIFEA